ncbi:ABC transporter substrate-binding protein [Nocardioides currus]|uniref:Glycine/betaine ABC transporter substrate-binding protein n=1 Tax=Nocardioides currus TaxID=2133958 RepID=A0A2R7YZ59_9ACTN|nr:ABC transporter substrate-binding protein [Nocardioides currus]PUA81653.1 glycine/betaine ABC transporter substrate-binding protein [Nocardioides currus]
MRRTPALTLTAVAALAVLTGCVESGRGDDASATSTNTTATAADCPWKPDESITTTARIAWQAIPNGDVIVKDQGILEACMPNATIEWKQAPSGGDVLKGYGSGDFDLGLMGSAPAARAASAPLVDQVDIDVVWIHDVIGDAESLVAKDATDVAGLKGKTIAVPFSSTAHYSLLQALGEAGLDPSTDVEVINLEPEAMPGAWQGEIDAAWIWEPAQTQLLDAGGTRILSSADTAKEGFPTFDVGTVDHAFAEANPEFLAQWIKAQDHAVALIEDDPTAAAESVAAVLGVSPEQATTQLGGLEFVSAADQAGPDYLGGQLGSDLFSTATFLLEQGEVEAVGDKQVYADHVSPSFAEAGAR